MRLFQRTLPYTLQKNSQNGRIDIAAFDYSINQKQSEVLISAVDASAEILKYMKRAAEKRT